MLDLCMLWWRKFRIKTSVLYSFDLFIVSELLRNNLKYCQLIWNSEPQSEQHYGYRWWLRRKSLVIVGMQIAFRVKSFSNSVFFAICLFKNKDLLVCKFICAVLTLILFETNLFQISVNYLAFQWLGFRWAKYWNILIAITSILEIEYLSPIMIINVIVLNQPFVSIVFSWRRYYHHPIASIQLIDSILSIPDTRRFIWWLLAWTILF
jgi:hypothetical protein